MTESKVPLKNPWLAATLAFLLPGAGHFYQGRWFKGAIYFCCVLGMFLYGQSLADWRVVYFRWDVGEQRYGYFAQVFVGLPALPALIQKKRWESVANAQEGRRNLSHAIDEDFVGEVRISPRGGDFQSFAVTGRLQLNPVAGTNGAEVEGRLAGVDAEGKAVTLRLGGTVFLGERVASKARRDLETEVQDDAGLHVGTIHGSVPRPFLDWYQVPLSDGEQQDLHARLGKLFELAAVYTWIAGLLNFLAFWDALDGPAYGIGDEVEEEVPAPTAAATAAAASPTTNGAAGPEPNKPPRVETPAAAKPGK